ncbi:protease SohB [Marinospirillum insulare]|uniref:Protease n=1 Tax=Marinospirillum insulare TaxID=217169 RepID=A0ABQ5ZYF2_9GAMM|nr:protease SohB [Marinospirillum insulare]GLR64328.1 protease [Marinospirillum insulare]
MWELLADYVVFVLKIATLLVALVILLVSVAAVKRSRESDEQLQVQELNERQQDLQLSLQAEWLETKAIKKLHKEKEKKAKVQAAKLASLPRVFVLDFKGDLDASQAAVLGREISLLLSLLRSEDEVVVRLESAGGYVHSYGHATAQLQRLRDKNIDLTVCVDRVAASGGYMMACTATKLLVAPFAILGSIGVVAEVPNLHRLLKKHEIDYEVLTAGDYKRTLTLLGENTPEGKQKFIDDLEQTHDLFKAFVQRCRPQLDIDKVTKGEVWYGEQALGLHLVDGLQTSEAYLLERQDEARVFKVRLKKPLNLTEKIAGQTAKVIEGRLLSWWPKLQATFFHR